MESTFCLDCLQEALRRYGTPEVFNTDQGAQFTSIAFIGALTEHPSISISRWATVHRLKFTGQPAVVVQE